MNYKSYKENYLNIVINNFSLSYNLFYYTYNTVCTFHRSLFVQILVGIIIRYLRTLSQANSLHVVKLPVSLSDNELKLCLV